MYELQYTDDELSVILALATAYVRDSAEVLSLSELDQVADRESFLNEMRLADDIARKTRLNLLQRGVPLWPDA